jgi:coenzyme F420-dependent glucose-6-phosphate dehydrogenase
MTAFGYTLSSEEHPPSALVANAQQAEASGFDFLSISDHYHPWVQAQGHSPFVWSVLGAIAETTHEIPVGVGVTCPTVRIHPAVLAQAAATVSLQFDGRFFLGVGTGEALNEHILGDRWPPPDDRRDMLREAVEVMRLLWEGETVTHRGDHYVVENARLFDPPETEVPVIVSAFGEMAVDLAADIGDGFWGNAPDADIINRYVTGGGTGPRYAQVHMCWAPDADDALGTVREIWPNGAIGGQLGQDLPTWTHFEQAAELVTDADLAEAVPCGPDVGPIVESARQYVKAGYDHVYFHQIGPDQAGFFEFWKEELSHELADLEPV